MVELIVTVAVIGVLAAIAAPGMADLVENSRVRGQTEELVASMQLARAEAIRRNSRVTVCGGSAGTCSGGTGWTGWTIFGRDPVAGTTDTIRDVAANAAVQITASADRIVFKPSGMIDGSESVEVSLNGHKRCITVLASGLVTVSTGECA